MKIILIGANGFVGSAFQRLLSQTPHEVIGVTRSNYSEFAGTSADLVIEAACNSRKFFAEEQPFEEFDASVAHRLRSLRDFPADFHLHVSSVDVYSDLSSPATTVEDQGIEAEHTSFYGLHKFMAEQLVRKYARNCLIVRLAGMVGPGLRKNPVFDILQGQPLRIHPESRYQFLSTDDAARLSWELVEAGVRSEAINVCGNGTITPLEIASESGKTLDLSLLASDASPRVVDVSVQKLKEFAEVPDTLATIRAFVSEASP